MIFLPKFCLGITWRSSPGSLLVDARRGPAVRQEPALYQYIILLEPAAVDLAAEFPASFCSGRGVIYPVSLVTGGLKKTHPDVAAGEDCHSARQRRCCSPAGAALAAGLTGYNVGLAHRHSYEAVE